ncbi:hypothetical protein JCM3766R1_007048 [Sporobolomyces carnicolor]
MYRTSGQDFGGGLEVLDHGGRRMVHQAHARDALYDRHYDGPAQRPGMVQHAQRSFVSQQATAHFDQPSQTPPPSLAQHQQQQRLQSQHAGLGDQQLHQNGHYPATHSRYSSASQQLQPSSPQRGHPTQSIPAPAPTSASQHHPHQARYVQHQPQPQPRQRPSPAYQQSPGVAPSPTRASFPSAPPPHAGPNLEVYAQSQTPTQPQSRPGVVRRRMSIEQSIAANLPPPSDSPQRHAPSPNYAPQGQQYRQVQLVAGQTVDARRIDEEDEAKDDRLRLRDEASHARHASQIRMRQTVAEQEAPIPAAPTSYLAASTMRDPSPGPGEDAGASISTAIFHTYVLDYLQRAGFLSTAAAFLAENPPVFTHPLDSGRTYPTTSARTRPSAHSSSTFTQSPTSASQSHASKTNKSPRSMPLFRSESGSSPISPSQQDASNHSTIESTTSTSTSTSHFGFDRSKSNGTDEEAPSPGDDKRRHGESGRSLMPAADVEHELEANGFLYEWFHVFHDVHSAKLRTGGSAQARALLATNAAAPTIGKRLRPLPTGRPVVVYPQHMRQAPATGAARTMPSGQQARLTAVPGRRLSNAQAPASARPQQPTGTQNRIVVTDRGAAGGGARQAPMLVRRDSQQQFIQHQRENQARQYALSERQKLQQLQMDQIEAQNQLPSAARQHITSASAPGTAAYHASMNANHRAQASHGSPNQFDPLDSSPLPIPDGSRYVLREPLARENGSERVATTNAAKPSLQRTHSQPLVQQVSSSGQDRLMPPGAMVGSSQSGRPPLVRSASTSIVEDEPAIQGIEEAGSIGSVTTAKRRRDSIVSANGLDTREIKRVRSTTDMHGQSRASTTMTTIGKSPLAVETDLSGSSPPSQPVYGREALLEEPDKTSAILDAEMRASTTPRDPVPPGEIPSQPVVSMEETEALLASLDATNENARVNALMAKTVPADELDVPTMTDAELDAFFAQSMNTLEATESFAPLGEVVVGGDDPSSNAPVSIPDTAEFDFGEYDSFFGSGATSYDPTTYDLRV